MMSSRFVYCQNGKSYHVVVAIVTCVVALVLFMYSSKLVNEYKNTPAGITVTDILGNGELTGYARAYLPREFMFPLDHGPHPEYRHEWWYYTGNLATNTGRRFGYQLTFFRFSLDPHNTERSSQWATTQMMMAHFAMTDVEDGKFYHDEKFSRVAFGLAGMEAQPFMVWIDNWSAVGSPDEIWPLKIHAVRDDIQIDLSLVPAKPVVLQGDRGLSRKGSEAGNASYYYSYTHLQTHGILHIGNTQYDVSGLSWLDREWGTSSLSRDQSGWDWFALQFSDDTEIMVYRLRRKDGSVDAFSSGTVIDAGGAVHSLASQDFSIKVMKEWQSPHTRVNYPARWRLTVADEALDLEIEPLLDDQELHVSLNYWEGAVKLHGTYKNKNVSGYGYVELTGYDETVIPVMAN